MTNDQMPVGPDYSTPIQEPALDYNIQASHKQPIKSEEQYSETRENTAEHSNQANEETQVFFSEGELWTVDSDLEATLPETKPLSELDFETAVTSDIYLQDEKILQPQTTEKLEETKKLKKS